MEEIVQYVMREGIKDFVNVANFVRDHYISIIGAYASIALIGGAVEYLERKRKKRFVTYLTPYSSSTERDEATHLIESGKAIYVPRIELDCGGGGGIVA